MQIIIEGIAVEYKDEGRGPIVLMLHGWKDNLHTFDALTKILLNDHRVIRVDLPGFGNTELPRSEWHLDDYVSFVKKFEEKVGIKADYMIGHSFGGRVIIKGTSFGIFRPKKIILIASAGVAERKKVRGLLIKVLAKTGAVVLWIPPLIFWRDDIRKKLYGYLGSDYLSAGPMKKIYLNVIKEDLSSAAATIKIPTLLIWGRNDAATPLKEGLKLSQLIEGSSLKIVDNAGHFVHQEQPQKVAEYVNDFLHD